MVQKFRGIDDIFTLVKKTGECVRKKGDDAKKEVLFLWNKKDFLRI